MRTAVIYIRRQCFLSPAISGSSIAWVIRAIHDCLHLAPTQVQQCCQNRRRPVGFVHRRRIGHLRHWVSFAIFRGAFGFRLTHWRIIKFHRATSVGPNAIPYYAKAAVCVSVVNAYRMAVDWVRTACVRNSGTWIDIAAFTDNEKEFLEKLEYRRISLELILPLLVFGGNDTQLCTCLQRHCAGGEL